MGYDMYMAKPIEGVAEQVAVIREQISAKVAERDKQTRGTPEYQKIQDQVMELWNVESQLRRDYFRLNIWGMGRYRDIMQSIGMGYWADPPGDWPKFTDFDLPENFWEDIDYGDDTSNLTEEQIKNFERFRQAQRDHLAARDTNYAGISLHKFTSNDGWLVTPQECSLALTIFGEWLEPSQLAIGSTDELDLSKVKQFMASSPEERKEALTKANARVLSLTPDELEEVAGDYWVQWLQFLIDAIDHDGFEVC